MTLFQGEYVRDLPRLSDGGSIFTDTTPDTGCLGHLLRWSKQFRLNRFGVVPEPPAYPGTTNLRSIRTGGESGKPWVGTGD